MQNQIRALEHISLNAWASLETEAYDGWLLRYGQGYTGRANSVQALDSSSLPLDQKISYCEAWYAAYQQPCIFRLTDVMQPPTLHDELIARDYHRYNDTLVQVAPLQLNTLQIDRRFRYQSQVSENWLTAWGAWNAVPEAHIGIAQKMLSHQTRLSCYGWIDDVAVGLAVVDGDYVGLFDIVVQADARRTGVGHALVSSLLAWAQQHAAKTAYLQVTETNTPARKLYDTLGFKTHHPYWYLRQREA
ncbi:MAG: GNAT family N-acetyltransferase [Phototrophicaceae bacterium]